MREMYLLVYKCRLCGKVYTNAGGLFDFTKVATGIHNCKNGHLGVSDLQGLVPEKE